MLHFIEKLNTKNLILASQSPRRQELLASLGLKFSAISLNISETYPDTLPVGDVPTYLAQQKAAAYPYLQADDLLITADTVVIFEGKIRNKPKDLSEAFIFLHTLQAKSHQVITGVCLKTLDKTLVFSSVTQVFFGALSEEDIQYYLKHGSPLDKAGGYGIQDWIGKVGIEKIDGDYYNVMGLPLQALCRGLRDMV